MFELAESRVRGVKPAVRARDHDTVACARSLIGPKFGNLGLDGTGIMGEDCRRGQIYSMMSYGTGL